ncbi:MAG: CpaD family pilus assembly protein [Magnetospirillum sp.]|nr:CpaD family pilus assembly protein [Magnetospirillum sp.]
MTRKTIAALLTVLLAPLLAACPADLSEHDYRLSHPIAVEEKAAVALFTRPADGAPLSVADRERLGRLAEEFLRRSAGPVQITVGAKPGEEEAAQAYGQSLADTLRAWGVTNVALALSGGADPVPPSGSAQVRVPVWVAQPPECGTFERGLNPNQTNAPHSNWGCAIQHNKAMMVQNPADLVRARESSGRDANRATTVLDKYGKGNATGSAEEAISAGTTSSVGSGK